MANRFKMPPLEGALSDAPGGDSLQYALDQTEIFLNSQTSDVEGRVDALETFDATASRWLNKASFLDIVNVATEQTFYSFSVTDNTLGTNRALRLVLDGDYLNNSGAARTLTLRVKYGAMTLFDDVTATIAASATRRSLRLELDLIADGAAAQILSGAFTLTAPHANTAGRGDLATALLIDQTFGGGSTVDSTATQTFAVTVQHSTNNASLSIRRQAAILSLI